MAQVEDQLMKCHITSPIAGTVLAKYAEAGELATMGKPLFKVADMEQMYIRAYITSEQLSQVKLGQKVTVFSDYGNDERKEYPGRCYLVPTVRNLLRKRFLRKMNAPIWYMP